MRLLHYYHFGYFEPIKSGADVIAANQMEYFRRRGWDVDVLLMSHPDRAGCASTFQSRYPWLRSVRVLDEPAGDFSFRGKLLAHQRAAQSECYRELASRGHDLFLANYVFAAPLVQGLPRDCVKVLEALDVMTRAFSLYQKATTHERHGMAPARDAFLWNMELELYRLFDAVLFINEQERRVVEPLYPGRTRTVPAMLPWELMPDQSAEGPPTGNLNSNVPFDLLFVGSNALANVTGLTFFYKEIFVPYLRKHKVRLGVIGKVCENLDFDDWYVTKLGNVPGNLKEHYARTKLVIVPILEGSGLSIKTIECLANGRAVATSPAGARGLRPDPEAFLQLDMLNDPRESATSILGLLNSRARRSRMQRGAREYYHAHFGADRYFSAMDEVMESLGIERSPDGSPLRGRSMNEGEANCRCA